MVLGMILIALGIFVSFIFIAWYRFSYALGLFIVGLPIFLGAPGHVVRFSVGPLPTTLMEVAFVALFLVWLVRYAREDVVKIKELIRAQRWLGIFSLIFFVSSLVSVFISGDSIPALGIWRAYFLEPMAVFVMVVGRGMLATTSVNPSLEKSEGASSSVRGWGGRSRISVHFLIWSLIISTVSISLFGIYQRLTGADAFSQGLGLPVLRRVTSFFTSPNAVGLYVGPILFLLIGLIVERLKSVSTVLRWKDSRIIILLLIGMLAIIVLGLTKSEGVFVALGAGMVVMLFFTGFRKIAIGLSLLAIVVGVAVPRIREAVLFHDPSGRVRLSLWQGSWNYLTESPTHFVFGAGLRQFQNKIQAPAQKYNFTKIEKQLYPHTVVLNFWVETGLFGMLSFFGLIGCMVGASLEILKKNKVWGASLLAMIAVMIVHGLVDVPYFKNDLAMLFWVLMAVVFLCSSAAVTTDLPRLKTRY